MCIRHQDKVATATLDAALDEMVQTAANIFYNRVQERKAKAQEREKRKDKCMPSCWLPFREALWKTPSP